ncbi:hypothetical protein BTHE68_39940 [Burkholderia sp. THE68]|nr:hypothetical protein BTHE68_39940 [Burkholderia sp. THE68]
MWIHTQHIAQRDSWHIALAIRACSEDDYFAGDSTVPIWGTKPVTEEPEITLIKRRIFQTDDGSRYFVGARPDFLGGRVSSAIVELDCVSRTGTTDTGRKYILVGAPGFDWDAAYTWFAWLKLNEPKSVQDVTFELFDENTTWT